MGEWQEAAEPSPILMQWRCTSRHAGKSSLLILLQFAMRGWEAAPMPNCWQQHISLRFSAKV